MKKMGLSTLNRQKFQKINIQIEKFFKFSKFLAGKTKFMENYYITSNLEGVRKCKLQMLE
jgi:hypothetical protein